MLNSIKELPMNWLIALKGNHIVLDNLEMSMRSPHFSIFDDSDDHQAKQYFLRSSHFEGNKSSKEVFSAASGLIQLINGTSAIEWGFNSYIRRGSISIDRVYNTSEDNPRESDWSIVNSPNKITPSNPFIGNPSRSRHINPYRYVTTAYLQLCIDHDEVFHLLRQLSVGFDWRNLYCIWDTISHYCGGQKKAIADLELDEVKIKAFTGTANNFGVLGLEARHGVMGWGIPQNTVEQEEAIEIINDVVKKYLNKKFCLNCHSKKWDKEFNNPLKGDRENAAAL